MGPPPPARFGAASKSSAATAQHTVSPQAATVSVPLPRPRPSKRARRIGAPVDRKYSPSYPARARTPPTRAAPRKRPRFYRYRGRVYEVLPDKRRHRTPPFE